MKPQKQESIKLNWGKRENMAYDELNDTYTCANGRTLKPIEVKIRESQTGYRKEVTIMNVKPAKIVLCV